MQFPQCGPLLLLLLRGALPQQLHIQPHPTKCHGSAVRQEIPLVVDVAGSGQVGKEVVEKPHVLRQVGAVLRVVGGNQVVALVLRLERRQVPVLAGVHVACAEGVEVVVIRRVPVPSGRRVDLPRVHQGVHTLGRERLVVRAVMPRKPDQVVVQPVVGNDRFSRVQGREKLTHVRGDHGCRTVDAVPAEPRPRPVSGVPGQQLIRTGGLDVEGDNASGGGMWLRSKVHGRHRVTGG